MRSDQRPRPGRSREPRLRGRPRLSIDVRGPKRSLAASAGWCLVLASHRASWTSHPLIRSEVIRGSPARAQRAATPRRGRGRITTIRARRSPPPASATSGLAKRTWSRPRRAPPERSSGPSGARSGSGQKGLEAACGCRTDEVEPTLVVSVRSRLPKSVSVLGWSAGQTATGWCVDRPWPGSRGVVGRGRRR